MSIFIRSPFNYDGDVFSFSSGLDCSDDPSRAQQHMRDECDINVMVDRFSRTGELPPAPPAPEHTEFTEVFDFQSAMNVLVAAERSFAGLPAEVRKRFGNDPAEMMQFLQFEENYDEALKYGLVEARDEPVPTPVEPEPTSTT